ncbi:M28 family metallopeptidase [Actinocorallia lasiicapitis]
MRSRFRLTAGAAAAVLALPLAAAAPAAADPNNNSVKKLVKAVSGANVAKHLQALQDIADANGGNRAAGTSGHDASRDYVKNKLEAAGYNVQLQTFTFPYFEQLSEATLERTAPTPRTYTDADFATMTYSGSGDVTGTVQAVDLVLPPSPTPSSTSGCETADFAGFTAGNIALLQRGTCSFAIKAANAQAAGASAVIIFNEGQPGRTDPIAGTLGTPDFTVPVVGTSFAAGEELAGLAGAVVHVKTDTVSENRTTENVIAESAEGRDDNVAMLGAHLDSVGEGPGINDNGSGSATILEVALQMAKVKPNNKVRFAWWSAEELGLLGSEHYVGTLSEADQAKIGLYLNLDMTASPNPAYKIYDGDDSDGVGEGAGPEGSAQIESLFESFYEGRGLGHVGTDFDGRSDYGPFIAVGIPSGGLFTGAEGIKTPAEAALFGGTAGAAYDPCYHSACDDINNIDLTALDVNADAVATAAATYAFDTSAINGIHSPGKSHNSGNSNHTKPGVS